MARKATHKATQAAALAPVQQPITETLTQNYMPYAMSVIVSRAIPEIDGFKPAHRKLLYTMYKMGLLRGARSKSANVVGQTMKLNPHGDAPIYDTLVRLTRGNGALLLPYVDSKGNFGRQYSRDMQYAASRYTEVKLEKVCEELFKTIDKETVDFVDNYDGTMQEPTLLPATFPTILANPNQGIAVGMASNICPFNLHELCEACCAYIADPSVDLLSLMPAPDFPGGGELLYDREQMAQIYETGRGSFQIQGRYRIDRKAQVIEIYEIPYTTTVEAIIQELTQLVKKNKLRDISDVRDETDLSGLKISIDYRRNSDPEQLMQRLFLQTSLKSSFSANFNLLIDGYPRQLGIKGILNAWLDFRRKTVLRELNFDLQRCEERLHLLRGLGKILLDIDRAIAIIRQTELESDVVPNLCAAFDIDALQANYIAEIRLRHLNREYLLARTADMTKLEEEAQKIRKILDSKRALDERIADELRRVAKQYGQARRTQLIDMAEVTQPEREDLIEDYRLRLFLTAEGYIKKLPLTSLRSAGELRTKEGDYIIQDIESSNRQELLLFTNRSKLYKMPVHEISDHKPSDMGAYGSNLLDLEADEQIVYIQIAADYQGELAFFFANGKALRLALKQYETKTRRRRLLNAYSDKSPLIQILPLLEARDIVLQSSDHKCLLLNSELLPLKATRSSQGVQVMTLRKGQKLLKAAFAELSDLEDQERYRVRKIPGRGLVEKGRSLSERQIDFGELGLLETALPGEMEKDSLD